MKILVFVHDLVLGGTTVNAVELAATLQRQHGIEIVFFSTPGPMTSLLSEHGIRYVPAPVAIRHPSVARMRALRALVRAEKPDLIHAWESRACFDAYYGVHLPWRVPLLVTDMQMYVTGGLPKKPWTTFGTPELVAAARAAGRSRAELLLPPVDTQSNAPGTVDGDTLRKTFGIRPAEILIVTVSRLVEELKGESLSRTIRAVDNLADHLPLRLLILGDGTARSRFDALAGKVNERHGRTVVLLPGALKDPRPGYAAADVVIGMGASALRGMAFEKPVLVVGERSFSLPFEPRTAEDFYLQGIYGIGDDEFGSDLLERQIVDLVNRRSEWPAIGAFSRSYVHRHHSLDALGHRLVFLSHRLLADRSQTLRERAVDALRTSVVYFLDRRYRFRAEPPPPMQLIDSLGNTARVIGAAQARGN